MSIFEKLRCTFGDVLRSVPSLHRKLARLAEVELCARNGTYTEPRTRTNGAYFKTFHSIGARKIWKISEFYKNWKLSLRSLYNFCVQVPLVERKSFFFIG